MARPKNTSVEAKGSAAHLGFEAKLWLAGNPVFGVKLHNGSPVRPRFAGPNSQGEQGVHRASIAARSAGQERQTAQATNRSLTHNLTYG